MTIFDLLFIVVFFAVIVMLVLAGVAALRGRRARAIAISRWLGIVAGLYLGIVILVSLISPRRELQVGDDQCWDDWCLTVTNVRRTPAENAIRYMVTIRISSCARRVAQRGRGTQVYLVDDRGRRYDPVPDPDAVPFDILLQPQEAVSTTRAFEIPADAHDPVLIATHGEGFPGWFIIGDTGSLFHKKTVVLLE
ncbi:MAG TPA: hypothetical protein VE999_16500 [Gemmataceae bacterium]|nr:hypothetical protein [Gemmataceae bacterium]